MRGWQHPTRLGNDGGDEEPGNNSAMRLGMVRTPAGEPSVAVRRGDDWVSLLTVPGADRLGPAGTDLLAFLKA